MNDDKPQTHRQGHGKMMALMCAPMLLIVGVLIATGVVGATAVFPALLCAGAMAVMMLAMDHTKKP